MQVKNIVVGTKYTKNGEERTKWSTIGACFIKDDGKMSIKLETVPLNWDGQAQIFDREQRQPQPTQAPSQYAQPPIVDVAEDSIPF